MTEPKLHEPVRFFSVGAFGDAVAKHIQSCRDDVSVTAVESSTANPRQWPTGRTYIIAAWRPVPDLCEIFDLLSHERQTPFVPLILDSATLYVGPIIIPGQGSCWNCWVRRFNQHDPASADRAILRQHYASHPLEGPVGYLAPVPLLAAARLLEVIDALDSSVACPGFCWSMDTLTGKTTSGTAVGINGCPRCGLKRPASTISFLEMQRALHHLWISQRG